jgi:hypothetical protein
MIPSIFFEDPFAINVSSEDLMTCFTSEKTEEDQKDIIDKIQNDTNFEDLISLYSDLVSFYMNKNLKGKGRFIVIHNAQPIVKSTESDGSIRQFFLDLGLDFSHMYGLGVTDIQILIIPCSILKCDPEYLIKKFQKTQTIEIWNNGKIERELETND